MPVRIAQQSTLLLVLLFSLVFIPSTTAQTNEWEDVLAADERFSIFYSLLSASGLTDSLTEDTYTIFAPDNSAFDEIPSFVQTFLVNNPTLLSRILSYHFVVGAQDAESVLAQTALITTEGNAVTVNASLLRINSADIIDTNISAGASIIHVIDRVVIPPISLPIADPFINFDGITIAGSSTVRPVTERMVELFEREGFSGNISLQETGTNVGIERFCVNAQVDIANASRPLRETEIEACQANNIDPFFMFVAIDSLAITVSLENDFVDNLTITQLGEIFSGTVTRWSEVNPAWPDETIQLLSPGDDSGTFVYFVEQVLAGDTNILLTNPNALFSEDDEELVRDAQNNPNAIAYFGYAYYIANQDLLRVVSIDGVEPNEATAESGEYPLARPLFIYTSPDILQAKPQVSAFVNYYVVNSPDQIGVNPGQIGYFAVSSDIQNLNRLKWLAAQE